VKWEKNKINEPKAHFVRGFAGQIQGFDPQTFENKKGVRTPSGIKNNLKIYIFPRLL
jgi:hypothetical protein